ncbi:MAG: mannose-6-phosphate isomerase, class I [Flavitalea sp.]
MNNSTTIFRLNGAVQNYDWGGFTFLPALLNLTNEGKKPFAEYWLGAHSKSPGSVMLAGNKTETLDVFIQENALSRLGEKVYERFGRLPYLLKVLDVKDMLSIQVHPSKQSAEKKFEEENNKSIPLQAAERNYKDNNHKPELLSPLGEVYLLHGFKEPVSLARLLKEIPELNFLSEDFKQGDYRSLYTRVMIMPQEEVNERLAPLLGRIITLYTDGQLTKSSEHFWAARAAITFNKNGNIDRGIFSVYFFNVVKVVPGEGLFQDAGLPHAYLEGHTMEIMANSDNVLRGGLTPKHIDVKELLEHVRFEPTVPNITRGVNNGLVEEVFITPAADFQLSRILLTGGKTITINTLTADIYFVYQGAVKVVSGEEEIDLSQGQSLLAIPAARLKLSAAGSAIVFRATAP